MLSIFGVDFQLLPWNQFRELDPTIVTRELPTKWQKEVFKRELITMLVSIHVENSGRLLGANKPIPKQFTDDNRSKSLRGSGFDFLRRPYLGGYDGAPGAGLIIATIERSRTTCSRERRVGVISLIVGVDRQAED